MRASGGWSDFPLYALACTVRPVVQNYQDFVLIIATSMRAVICEFVMKVRVCLELFNLPLYASNRPGNRIEPASTPPAQNQYPVEPL